MRSALRRTAPQTEGGHHSPIRFIVCTSDGAVCALSGPRLCLRTLLRPLRMLLEHRVRRSADDGVTVGVVRHI